MVAAAHASMATAHSAAAAAHPSSAHAVTAAATGMAAMLLTAVGGGSVRGLIGSGDHPLAAEIHGRIRRGRQRQCSQQAKRKYNTHASILLFVMIRIEYNAPTQPAPTSAGEKRGNQT
jgi:hypothetical protein